MFIQLVQNKIFQFSEVFLWPKIDWLIEWMDEWMNEIHNVLHQIAIVFILIQF